MSNNEELKKYENKEKNKKNKKVAIKELEELTNRCLQCKIPKCIEGCPHKFDIPRFVKLIKEKKYNKALELYFELTPFPSTLSLICPHTCEESCVLSKKGAGLPVSKIKRILSTNFGVPKSFFKLEKRNGKSIAIIGSGPAGLKAAFTTVKSGYNVTIFEKYNELGGMLVLGIPEFRLPRKIIRSEIDRLKKLGIKFKNNYEVDKRAFQKLINSGEYSAIIIAIGAHTPRKMNIKGEDSPDVLQALNFLKDYNLNKKIEIRKKVAVIGGGNVAFDTARVSKRLGADVTILYRRSENEMPGSKHELNKVIEEDIKINYLTTPIEILTKNNRVEKLKLIKLKLGEPDKSGRHRPIPIDGSEYEMEFETVIEAIGQKTSLDMVFERFGINKNNNIHIENDFAKIDNIFIIGDCFTGPSTVIESIKSADHACEMLINDLK
ncbi:MAG: FAD-dependent oxidoreductase [Candidatus Helarchaeota archaeon]